MCSGNNEVMSSSGKFNRISVGNSAECQWEIHSNFRSLRASASVTHGKNCSHCSMLQLRSSRLTSQVTMFTISGTFIRGLNPPPHANAVQIITKNGVVRKLSLNRVHYTGLLCKFKGLNSISRFLQVFQYFQTSGLHNH